MHPFLSCYAPVRLQPVADMKQVCQLLVDLTCLTMLLGVCGGPLQHEPEAAVPSDIDAHPFTYRPLPAANVCYMMVEGVVRVFSDSTCTQELYPVPGSAADFFTDMHR